MENTNSLYVCMFCIYIPQFHKNKIKWRQKVLRFKLFTKWIER
jgi:hypothetical protein